MAGDLPRMLSILHSHDRTATPSSPPNQSLTNPPQHFLAEHKPYQDFLHFRSDLVAVVAHMGLKIYFQFCQNINHKCLAFVVWPPKWNQNGAQDVEAWTPFLNAWASNLSDIFGAIIVPKTEYCPTPFSTRPAIYLSIPFALSGFQLYGFYCLDFGSERLTLYAEVHREKYLKLIWFQILQTYSIYFVILP